MMRRLIATIFIFNCVVILPGIPKSQGAILLGQASYNEKSWTNTYGHPVDGWLLTFSIITTHLDTTETALIGANHLWTEPGQVLFTAQNEPEWDAFVAILTNGKDDSLMSYRFAVSGGTIIGGVISGGKESHSFGRESDFFGCTVEYMTLDVTDLYYDDAGTLEADFLLSVYGTPEPATILLLGLGGLFLRGRRK